jgi:hypothetical protein
MKKTIFKMTLVFTMALFVMGCSSMNRTIKESSINVDFNRNDFEFSDQLSATGVQVKIFGVDWKRLFHKENGGFSKASVMGNQVKLSTADSYAISELLKTYPGYDVVFYPYFERKHKRFLIFFSKDEVLVKARLAKIK